MIGRINHIAIVVPDLKVAAEQYQKTLGADVSEVHTLSEHGVECVFVNLINTKVELLHPIDEESPVYKFLMRNPDGAMHHICYEVEDIEKAKELLVTQGAKILGDGKTKIGAHGKPVLFLSPKSFSGVMIELEQA